jgi:autophagy-related protein 9
MYDPGTSKKRRPTPTQPSSLSTSEGPSSSLPFLNLLNPMRSVYHGYTQANSTAGEEEGGGNIATEDVDLEAGPSNFHSRHEGSRLSSKAEGKRRVAWDAGASEMTALHPNIHKEDEIHEDSSDDEVPQSFKVQATPHADFTTNFEALSRPARGQALYSTSGRKVPPTLPAIRDKSKSPSPAPRSSEAHDHGQLLSPHTRSSSLPRQPRTLMRGLDDYERALWNWANVYNLDAFLQEVYLYYEGNGIYSIALDRGLKLL